MKVNNEIVYTDRNGVWTYRSRKKLATQPTVLLAPEENIAPGEFQIIDASNPAKIILD